MTGVQTCALPILTAELDYLFEGLRRRREESDLVISHDLHWLKSSVDSVYTLDKGVLEKMVLFVSVASPMRVSKRRESKNMRNRNAICRRRRRLARIVQLTCVSGYDFVGNK